MMISGCASNEVQVRQALQKDPKIIFDLIEENPEQFVASVNRAARKAQQKQYEQQLAEQKNEQENDLKNPKKPKLEVSRRLLGSDSGKIVIVEFADFQCPACRVAYDALKQFKLKYKNQVQFYYKHMPLDFHKMAMPAALYFEALRLQDKEKAIQFYDTVFQNQKELSDVFLKKTAQQVGADIKRLEKDMATDAVKNLIEADMAEFQKFGFTGTPVVILNGVALNGAQPLEELERVAQLTKK